MKATRGGKPSAKSNNQSSKAVKGKGKKNTDKSALTKRQYAELLVQFVQPVMSGTPDIEELEEKLNIGLTAWNLAVIKQNDASFYKDYSERVLPQILSNKKLKQQIDKLIQSKNKDYRDYNFILTNCEIVANEKDEAVIHVQSKTYEQFVQDLITGNLDEMYEKEEEETASGSFNRTAIAVLPKAPFLDWIKKNVFAGEPPPIADDENVLYLIDAVNSKKEVEKWLKKNFDELFSNELNEWTGEEEIWPKKRTYKMFWEWFDVKICSVIYDLGTSPLIKE